MLQSNKANRVSVSMTRVGVIVYVSPNLQEKIGPRVGIRFDKDEGGKVAVHLITNEEGWKLGKSTNGPDYSTWANRAQGKRFLGSNFFGKTECEVVAVEDHSVIALLPALRSKARDRHLKSELMAAEAERVSAKPKVEAPASDLDKMLDAAKRHGMIYDVARNRFIPPRDPNGGTQT